MDLWILGPKRPVEAKMGFRLFSSSVGIRSETDLISQNVLRGKSATSAAAFFVCPQIYGTLFLFLRSTRKSIDEKKRETFFPSTVLKNKVSECYLNVDCLAVSSCLPDFFFYTFPKDLI